MCGSKQNVMAGPSAAELNVGESQGTAYLTLNRYLNSAVGSSMLSPEVCVNV